MITKKTPIIKAGIVIDIPKSRIRVHKRTIHSMGDPGFVQLLMYEKRAWGEYMVLDYRIQSDGRNSLTKHLVIQQGKHISYQRHSHRSEIWIVLDGNGKLIIDGITRSIKRGDTAYITPGMKHAVEAETELHIIEVQIGDELTEDDIERLEWNW